MIAGDLRGFGCRLVSQIAVPGALPCATMAGQTVTIRLAPAGTASPIAGFARHGDAVLYSHPHGRFACTPAGITITPAIPPDDPDLGALLVANALPAVLWQRRAYMLHATALSLDGGPAFAIAGPSGSGKSTLAAQILAQGAHLLADDSLALTWAGRQPWASGLSGGYFLGTPRRFHHAPRTCDRAALACAFFLEPGPPGLTRLPPPAALERLLTHRHRGQVPQLLGRHVEVLHQARALAEAVPAYAWHRTPTAIDAAELAMLGDCVRKG